MGEPNYCPQCGAGGENVDVKYSAILAGPAGGYRIPAWQVMCSSCKITSRVKDQ